MSVDAEVIKILSIRLKILIQNRHVPKKPEPSDRAVRTLNFFVTIPRDINVEMRDKHCSTEDVFYLHIGKMSSALRRTLYDISCVIRA